MVAYTNAVPTNWYDVTDYNVLSANSASTNATSLNTLIAAAPSGSTIYFPAGTFAFSGSITVAGAYTFQGQLGQGGNTPGTTLQTTSTTAGLFAIGGNWGNQFRDLTFSCTTTQTSSAAALVACGANDYTNFFNCAFVGGVGTGGSGTLYTCVSYSGSGGGNISYMQNCSFASYTGIALLMNGGAACNFAVSTCTLNGAGSAVAGINIQSCGSIQMSSCDVIGNVNNVLINPTTGNQVSSFLAQNCFFDNSAGDCVLITGAGATTRAKLSNCYVTVAAGSTAYNGINNTSTYAATTSGIGLDIVNCNILNTYGNSSTSSNGIHLTGAADFRVSECNIAGWDGAGISVTGIATAGVTKPAIFNNIIGPCAGYSGNGTGVAVTATNTFGSFTVQGNVFTGNTTAPWSQTANIAIASGSVLYLSDNIGLCSPLLLGTAFTSSATGTAAQSITGFSTWLPIGTYLITALYPVALPSAFIHTFAFTFSGTQTGPWTQRITPFTTTEATLTVVGSAATAITTGIPTPTLVAADYYTIEHTCSITVTAAGTLQATVANTTSTDSITLAVGSTLSIVKAA